jgi:hypothetical protein
VNDLLQPVAVRPLCPGVDGIPCPFGTRLVATSRGGLCSMCGARRIGAKARLRARTVAQRRGSKEELSPGCALPYPDDVERPLIRLDCLPGGINAERPCPFAACRHHLLLDVMPTTGSLKLLHAHDDPALLAETCALDVADRGEHTLYELAAVLNVTRERVRQIQDAAIAKIPEERWRELGWDGATK